MKILVTIVSLCFLSGERLATVENSTNCFEGLGCFFNLSQWYSPQKSLLEPVKSGAIHANIYLYTRKSKEGRHTIILGENVALENSDFDSNRPFTAFITHGFYSNGNVPWVTDLKDAYLKNRDANVFVVDWGTEANSWNYMQVLLKARIVGAELTRLLEYLITQKGLVSGRIHLIGHSIGAHISSYAAKALQTIGQHEKIAQLTALDPAQPGFETRPEEERLCKNDAEFVDVIHTNTRPFALLGFGFTFPAGHNDYYMNGGLIQPGCRTPPVNQMKIKSITDLAKYPEVISTWVACSHGKAYLYYIEALSNNSCTFWGRSAGIVGNLLDIGTFGISEKIITKFVTCSLDCCSPIGLEAKNYPARGVFAVPTNSITPYCCDTKNTETMKEQRSSLLEKQNVTEKNGPSLSKIITSLVG